MNDDIYSTKDLTENNCLIVEILKTIKSCCRNDQITRKEFIGVLYAMSIVYFCEETKSNEKQKCEEIDSFCNALKSYALKNSVRA